MSKNAAKLVRLVSTTDLSYNVQGKDQFHRLARSVCRDIAKALELPTGSFEVRSNKAGDAVSGEVTLHGEHIYIQFSQGSFGGKFMFRYCKHQKDYTGGINRWMRWEQLTDFEDAVREFKLAMQNAF